MQKLLPAYMTLKTGSEMGWRGLFIRDPAWTRLDKLEYLLRWILCSITRIAGDNDPVPRSVAAKERTYCPAKHFAHYVWYLQGRGF